MSRGLWTRLRPAMAATAGALMVTLMAALWPAPWPAGAAADVGTEAPRGLAAWASAPRRQNAGEHIASFDSAVTVSIDGSASITETIVYDFGNQPHHGIDRQIPTRFAWEGATPRNGRSGAQYDRVTPLHLDDVSVDATAAPVQRTDEADGVKLRIGDADVTISGVHTYTIRYTLRGVLNGFVAHDELYLNVTGNETNVAIDAASAAVAMPASVGKVACFEGPPGSKLSCGSAQATGENATFSSTALAAGEGLTVVVAIPKGVAADPSATAVFEERRTLSSAFALTPLVGVAGGGLLLAGLAGVGAMAWRVGRDRRYAGSAVDAAFGNASGAEKRVPLRGSDANPVEFVPPEGIRPGHLGTVLDEQANHLDVSAMIVDLAVRGWLRIEEVEPAGSGFLGFGRSDGDYRLVKLRDAVESNQLPPEQRLWSAETTLLGALFRDGNSPLLSELRTQFASRLAMVQSRLYDDTVDAGWFPTRPDRVRARWRSRGFTMMAVGVGLVVLAARFTHLGLVALPVPVIGFAMAGLSGRFPARTAKGSAMLGRIRGFRELFEVGEGERMRFAESHHVFAQYLPYAIVFGCTDKWAETFASLGATPEEMGLGTWYVSPYGYDSLRFGHAMRSFTTTSTGSMAAATPSSSGGASSGGSGFGGGFSGGGFGGGGTSSW